MLDIEIRESPIEGLGMFAVRPFRPGETIRRMKMVREITSEAPIRSDLGERQDHCRYPDSKVFLVGYPDRHINHSCDPNSFTRYTDQITKVIARRDIQPGEEITLDYLINTAEGDSWPCNCLAPRCRKGTGRGFFALPVELQHEYLPLLERWFVRQHRRRLELLKAEGGPIPGS